MCIITIIAPGPHVSPEIFEGATTPLDSDIFPQPGVQLTYCNENFEAIASANTEIRLRAAIGHARKHPELSRAKIAVIYQVNVSTLRRRIRVVQDIVGVGSPRRHTMFEFLNRLSELEVHCLFL